MPNMDRWINQKEATNKLETHLLYIIAERQKMIRPNCHPTIHKMKKAMLKDDVSLYRLQETTIDYVLFRIRELTGKLI